MVKKNPIKFEIENGLEIELQIDESLLGKKRKYNKGKYFQQQWVFGISNQKKHKCFLQVVTERSKDTLYAKSSKRAITTYIKWDINMPLSSTKKSS